jgi:hypothetical protein
MSQVFFLDEFNFPIKKNINIFKFIVGILFYNLKGIKFLCYKIQFSSHNQTTKYKATIKKRKNIVEGLFT